MESSVDAIRRAGSRVVGEVDQGMEMGRECRLGAERSLGGIAEERQT